MMEDKKDDGGFSPGGIASSMFTENKLSKK